MRLGAQVRFIEPHPYHVGAPCSMVSRDVSNCYSGRHLRKHEEEELHFGLHGGDGAADKRRIWESWPRTKPSQCALFLKPNVANAIYEHGIV